MRLTYVIITRDRRQRLLQTLQKLVENTSLQRSSWEAIVVDNGSTDDTAAAVRHEFPWVTLIALPENEGMPARNHAFGRAQGRYLALLDDDSYPTPEAMPVALNYMGRRPKTAALVARVLLPDETCEAPAFPAVLLGGATILRRSVIDEVGGFAPEFFRQAEEYDLSFRIWAAGYQIERFEDVCFRHDKSPGGRSSALTCRMDLRNNLILVERYLPASLRRQYRRDWIGRYVALARHCGQEAAADAGLREARVWARREASVGRKTLDARSLEQLFAMEQQRVAVARFRDRSGSRRVVIADVSKNLYATWRACQLAGLEVAAIADDRPAFAGQRYRKTPILPPEQAIKTHPDGVVISNINPAQIDSRIASLRHLFAGPMLRLWEPRYLQPPATPSTHAA